MIIHNNSLSHNIRFPNEALTHFTTSIYINKRVGIYVRSPHT